MNYTKVVDIDSYQAKMLIALFRSGMQNNQGIMEAFTRKLPAKRSFMLSCGTERILEYLYNLKFTTDDIKIIRDVVNPSLINEFSEADGNYLASIDFSSLKVRAVYDGDVLFASEPIVQIEGPVGVVQYIEKHILGIINHDVRIASKAARIVIAAGDAPVVEMGGRRAHEEATADAARACYIAGFLASSSVMAYAKYGVPHLGTMGHVYIMAYNIAGKSKRKSQQDAFSNWSKVYKDSTYLVDTYNTLDGVSDAVKFAPRNLGGVRFDSGDLTQLSVDGRRILYSSDGNAKTKIIATNDLNEYKIMKMKKAGASVDSYGVGTEAVCTPDSPTCNFVYKLVSIEDGKENWKDVAKFSEDGKSTFPCAKQIQRHFDPHTGVFTHDEIIKAGAKLENNAAHILVERNVKNWTKEEWDVEKARALFKARREAMPQYLKLIQEKVDDDMAHKYTVNISEDLVKAQRELKRAE